MAGHRIVPGVIRAEILSRDPGRDKSEIGQIERALPQIAMPKTDRGKCQGKGKDHAQSCKENVVARLPRNSLPELSAARQPLAVRRRARATRRARSAFVPPAG